LPGNAIVVPLQALVVREGENRKEQEGVYVVEEGAKGKTTRFQQLETGLIGDLSIEVVKGLKGGETVVTGPFKALRTLNPGDAVILEKPKKEGEGRREESPSN
ncbi:MAG TPA: hypothetical protein VFR31_12420, partial [Thermoanaerobaculia bacterium]|nr:hypothetical protein [Thermoanaerobaculia bacterium]